MARASKPSRKRKTVNPAAPRVTSHRDKAIAALMALLAEHPFEQIGLAEIAGRAGVSLSDLRGEFGSVLAILAAHIKAVDRAVLARVSAESDEDPARERLFEVLMLRLEALAPYKDAVRSLMRSARRNPGLALALNGLAVRSQHWMLTAAHIGTSGARGTIRAQGTALLFARVVAVWVDDDEPGLDRTMAALDRALASGERWAGFLDDLCAIPACLARGPRRRRRRPADEGAAEAEAA